MSYEITINNKKKYSETLEEMFNIVNKHVYLSEATQQNVKNDLICQKFSSVVFGFTQVDIDIIPTEDTPTLYRISVWFKNLYKQAVN